MGDFADLFNGIAVVIDDELSKKNGGTEIHNILKQLEDKKIPYITYTELPSTEQFRHIAQAAFIILDWKLCSELDAKMPMTISSGGMEDEKARANIDFIKKIREYSFQPIFIFSNESIDNIINVLRDGKILFDTPEKNLIYVGNKIDLLLRKQRDSNNSNNESPLLIKINEFIQNSPQLLALKRLETELQSATLSIYKELGKSSHNWPAILMKAFSSDGVDAEWEFRNFMVDSVVNRVNTLGMEKCIPNSENTSSSTESKKEAKRETDEKPESDAKKELRLVLEKARFIPKSSLRDENPAPGDLFKVENEDEDNSTYWVNIRAHCDTIPSRSEDVNAKLYCLEGQSITGKDFELKKNSNKTSGNYEMSYGQLVQKTNSNVVFFINDEFAIKFSFKSFEIKEWEEFKEYRVGRILPPYSDELQQRFASYITRKGLQRIPEEMFLKD